MSRTLLLFALLIPLLPTSEAQPIGPVLTLGGLGEDTVLDLSSHSGTTCATGRFEATADFGGTTLTAAGASDGYLACYEESGALQWARRVGASPGADAAHALLTAPDGSVWVVGHFSESARFDGGAQPDIVLESAGGTDVFTARYSASGDLQQVATGGGLMDDTAHDVARSSNGQVTVVGAFRDRALFGSTPLTSAGSTDAFVLRYSAQAQLLWAVRGGGTGDDAALTVTASDEGLTYVGGGVEGIALFPPLGVQSAGGRDGVLVAYGSDGSPSWARTVGGPEDDTIEALDWTPDGSLYAAGSFSATVQLGLDQLTSAGADDAFLARLSQDGFPLWARRAGGGRSDRSGAVSVSGGEIVWVATLDGEATINEVPLPGFGSTDALLALFGTDGVLSNAYRLGGSASDSGNAIAHATGSGVGLYMGGQFEDIAHFGPTSVESAGAADGYIARLLSPDPDVLFVRASAPDGGDGRTWSSAYRSLAVALANTPPSTRALWIAEGSYTDGPFVLKDSLALYGGFRGAETTLDERDPLLYPTILDGSAGIMVVRANGVEGARLDGLQILNGRTGVSIVESDLTILNTVIADNRVRYSGGGIAVGESTLRVERTTIRGNSAWDDQFEGSYAQGGGLAARNSTLRFTDVVFESNFTEANVCSRGCGSGGGAAFFDDVDAVFIRTRFVDNSSQYTGAFSAHFFGAGAGSLTFISCDFIGNSAYGAFHHSAVSVFEGSNATFVNSSFSDNYAEDGPVLVGDTLTVVNSTFVGNRQGDSFSSPGGIEAVGPEVVVHNSIFFDNTGPDIAGDPLPTVTFSLVEEGFSGPGNLDGSPLLNPDGIPQAGSPVIDHGINTYVPSDTYDLDGDGDTLEPLPYDLGGRARFVGPGVDLGAYEFNAQIDPTAPAPIQSSLTVRGLSPNPSQDGVQITYSLGRPAVLHLSVVDLLGRTVLEQSYNSPAGVQRGIALSVSSLSAGVYIVRLRDESTGVAVTEQMTVLR